MSRKVHIKQAPQLCQLLQHGTKTEDHISPVLTSDHLHASKQLCFVRHLATAWLVFHNENLNLLSEF